MPLLHRMKFLPGRMLWELMAWGTAWETEQNTVLGAWRACLPSECCFYMENCPKDSGNPWNPTSRITILKEREEDRKSLWRSMQSAIGFQRISFLNRCNYSLYSDTILTIGYVSNETNTDVHMYISRIYSSRPGYIAAQSLK